MSSRSHAIFHVVVEEYHHRGDIARVLGGEERDEDEYEDLSDEDDDAMWIRSMFKLNFIDL